MARGEKWSFKEHLPYRVFYLIFYAGYMPVLLFLPIYLKYNGLTTVQVGLITGLRPLLQAIGAPILIKLCSKFHARKLLFVVSGILMIGKYCVIFLILRRENAICRTTYTNGSIEDTDIKHSLTKREVMDEWLQVLNYTPNDLNSFQYYNTKKSFKLQNVSTDKNKIWSTILPSVQTPSVVINNTKILQHQIMRDDEEVKHIFITIILLSLATDYFDACIHSLVDSVYASKFKWIWSDMVWAVVTFIIGIVVDHNSQEICGEMIGAFHNVFYFSVVFVGIALLIGFYLDLTIDPYEVDTTKKILSSKWNFQYNIFILAYTLMGFCNGFLFSFLYWFIDLLHGNAMIMGLSTCTEGVFGILIFTFVNPLLKYIGYMSTICVCFVGYIGVFLSFYGINDPWLVIAAKVPQALVSGVMMLTCCSFLKTAEPAGSSYQMQGNK